MGNSGSRLCGKADVHSTVMGQMTLGCAGHTEDGLCASSLLVVSGGMDRSGRRPTQHRRDDHEGESL